MHCHGNFGEHLGCISIDECFNHLFGSHARVSLAAASRDQLECRQGVACRAATFGDYLVDRFVRHLQPGILHNPAHMFFQLVGRQEAELQVLGAAANRVADLLWIGRGKHEHHVRGRFFEGLQQGGFGPSAQHVHFVEDEHPMPTRVAHGGSLDEFTNVVDAVVTRSVEFENVKTRTTLNGETRLAFTTRLALCWVGAVEHFGEDSRRRRLSGAARPRKEVCLAATIIRHGVAQGAHDVLLAL